MINSLFIVCTQIAGVIFGVLAVYFLFGFSLWYGIPNSWFQKKNKGGVIVSVIWATLISIFLSQNLESMVITWCEVTPHYAHVINQVAFIFGIGLGFCMGGLKNRQLVQPKSNEIKNPPTTLRS